MRRLLIGTVAALALSASAAAPAQANHDAVCVPAVPGPVCVTGLQHVVPGTQDALWAEFLEVWLGPVTGTGQTGWGVVATIPDPLCSGPDFAPLCINGLRGLAAAGYGMAGALGGGFTFYGVCVALGKCAPPVP